MRRFVKPLVGLIVLCAISGAPQAPVATAQPVAAPAQTLSGIRIHSEALPSGLRLIVAKTAPIAGREPRAYVTTYVLHGTMQESVPGLAHLMEHVVANSPELVPSPAAPAGLQPIGSNALTRPYYTSFYRLVPPAMLPHIIPHRVSRVGAIRRDDEVLRREQGRVVDELERQRATFFTSYKPLTMLSLGLPLELSKEIANAREVAPGTLFALIDRHYHPRNAVLLVIGDVDIAKVRAMAREADARRLKPRRGMRANRPAPLRPLRFGQSRVIEGQSQGEQHRVGAAWPKPAFGARDQLALLIAEHLLLGGFGDPAAPSRPVDSPLGDQLKRLIGATSVHDGRTDRWLAPSLVDAGENINAVIFDVAQAPSPAQARAAVGAALQQVRRGGMSDEAILQARTELAAFYEQWLLEPTYRILGDHLMAHLVTGRDPRAVLRLPERIRRVSARDVRAAFDRYFGNVEPNIVVLPAANGG